MLLTLIILIIMIIIISYYIFLSHRNSIFDSNCVALGSLLEAPVEDSKKWIVWFTVLRKTSSSVLCLNSKKSILDLEHQPQQTAGMLGVVDFCKISVKEGGVCMRYLMPRYVWYVVFLLWVRGRTLLISADYTQQKCFTGKPPQYSGIPEQHVSNL